MAVVYYPLNSIVARRNTISSSYEQLVLTSQPDVILCFYTGSDVNQITASNLFISASYAISSSWAPVESIIITGSTYPVTSSISINSISASYLSGSRSVVNQLTSSFINNSGSIDITSGEIRIANNVRFYRVSNNVVGIGIVGGGNGFTGDGNSWAINSATAELVFGNSFPSQVSLKYAAANTASGQLSLQQTDALGDANLKISGSLFVSKSIVTNQSITASSFYGTSSYTLMSISSSYADNSISSSYLINNKGYINLTVQSAKLPTTSSARIDAGSKLWKLLFNASSNQSASWQFIVPSNYSSNPILNIKYGMSANQGIPISSSAWAIKVGSIDEGINTETFPVSTNILTSSMSSSQAALTLITTSIELTNNNLIANELAYLELERLANAAIDTATGDAQLVGLTLEYNTI